jgi:glycosyltransferase involved in cell wall biosynthesis
VQPRVSVVICAYTEARWDDLLQAVRSVQAQGPAELIVVVDHNPGLLRRVHSEIPSVLAVENTGRRGLSDARNSGVRASTGEVIALIDDDAVACPGWLERLLAPYGDADVLGVGGRVTPLWESGRPRWFPEEFDWVVGCSFRGMPESVRPVASLIGCNLSFRREVFDALAGFKADLGRIGTVPMGCEETEFCLRAGQQFPGGRWIFEPAAEVMHRVPRARARLRYFQARCYAEGQSKAAVAASVGAGRGLARERTYVSRTLPAGVLRNAVEAVRSSDPRLLLRATAIAWGLTCTTAGYLGVKV